MAESTASYQRAHLQAEVGEYLGFGRDTSIWVSDFAYMANKVDSCIKSGVNQACEPPMLSGDTTAHSWSFLKVWGTLTTVAPYSTGTITATNASAVVTLASGTFPSTAAAGIIVIHGTPYEISTRDSGTQVTLAQAYQGTTESGLTYSVSQWDYDLPDNFGHFAGPLSFSPSQNLAPIKITDDSAIMLMRQGGVLGGEPEFVCERASSTLPTSTGQRFIASFDRPPQSAYQITYRYRVLPDALTSSNYPVGGSMFGELILASCLAVAEYRHNNVRGEMYAAFMDRLTAAVSIDSQRGADSLGYNGDGGCDSHYGTGRFGNFPNLTFE